MDSHPEKRRIRQHFGNYERSMATTTYIEPTLEAIIKHICQNDWRQFEPETLERNLILKYLGIDERNGWDCYLVTIRNEGVWGLIEGPIINLKEERDNLLQK